MTVWETRIPHTKASHLAASDDAPCTFRFGLDLSSLNEVPQAGKEGQPS